MMAEPVRIRPTEELNAALQKAIMAGDAGRMKTLLDNGADPNAKDDDGTPALMNAALYGSAAHMKLLVDRKAAVDARNAMDATALLWAAGDPAKARLLMEHGADVNAQSKMGRTPLMVAASVAGNASTVRMMLAKGARVDVKDNVTPIPIIPAGGGKGTALIDAARTGDIESVEMLLDAGADVRATDGRNATALSEAVMYSRRDVVRKLLDAGADATGAITMLKFSYMSLAAMRGDVQVARLLAQHKAPSGQADAGGNTPLMFAAASERDNAGMVSFLLQAGAAVNAKNRAGETALDWARRRGEKTAIVDMLRAAGAESAMEPGAVQAGGAMGPVTAEEAVSKALALLAGTAASSFQKGGCASCHNHTLPMVASAVAARKGIAVDPAATDLMMKYTISLMTPVTGALLEGSGAPPDMAVGGGYVLEALRAQKFMGNRTTAAVVHNVAQMQMADGRWVGWAPRGPLESGDIQATAMSIRALRQYPIVGRQAEMSARIARAQKWLREAVPVTTEEYIMRLEGLVESGASQTAAAEAAKQLAALQRADGGWGQLPGLASDAYATGKALVALTRARATVGDRKAAMAWLRAAQQADGSWRVTTRAYPFQPLKDTGFPHGRDQWISAAGTSWAAMALAMNLK